MIQQTQHLQKLQTARFTSESIASAATKKKKSTSMILCGKHLQNIYSYIKDNLCASKIFFFCHKIIIN